MSRTMAVALLAVSLTLTPARAGADEKPRQYDGKVTSLHARHIQLALRDGSTGSWTLAPNAKLARGKKDIALADVKAGHGVVVLVSKDGVIHELRVVSYKPEKGHSDPVTAKAQSWSGDLCELSPKQEWVALCIPDTTAPNGKWRQTDFQVDGHTTIRARGRDARFADLKIHDRVRLRAAAIGAPAEEIFVTGGTPKPLGR